MWKRAVSILLALLLAGSARAQQPQVLTASPVWHVAVKNVAWTTTPNPSYIVNMGGPLPTYGILISLSNNPGSANQSVAETVSYTVVPGLKTSSDASWTLLSCNYWETGGVTTSQPRIIGIGPLFSLNAGSSQQIFCNARGVAAYLIVVSGGSGAGSFSLDVGFASDAPGSNGADIAAVQGPYPDGSTATGKRPVLIGLFDGTAVRTVSGVAGRPTGTMAISQAGATFSDLSRTVTANTQIELTTSAGELVNFNVCSVTLAVTGTVSGTTPTLNVRIQVSADGTTWDDRISFSQVTATNNFQEASVSSGSLGVTAYVQNTLAAGSIVDGTFPGRMRINYTVGGTSPSFGGTNVRAVCK